MIFLSTGVVNTDSKKLPISFCGEVIAEIIDLISCNDVWGLREVDRRLKGGLGSAWSDKNTACH